MKLSERWSQIETARMTGEIILLGRMSGEEVKITAMGYWHDGDLTAGWAGLANDGPIGFEPTHWRRVFRSDWRFEQQGDQAVSEGAKRENCDHPQLQFSSGDYYVLCPSCHASWVMREPNKDIAAPDLSNKGLGAQLSGELRVKAGPKQTGNAEAWKNIHIERGGHD